MAKSSLSSHPNLIKIILLFVLDSLRFPKVMSDHPAWRILYCQINGCLRLLIFFKDLLEMIDVKISMIIQTQKKIQLQYLSFFCLSAKPVLRWLRIKMHASSQFLFFEFILLLIWNYIFSKFIIDGKYADNTFFWNFINIAICVENN